MAEVVDPIDPKTKSYYLKIWFCFCTLQSEDVYVNRDNWYSL
jgi:hypothetical protein